MANCKQIKLCHWKTGIKGNPLRISSTVVLQARCHVDCPTNSVKALKETQNTNPNRWSDLIHKQTEGVLALRHHYHML